MIKLSFVDKIILAGGIILILYSIIPNIKNGKSKEASSKKKGLQANNEEDVLFKKENINLFK